MKRASKTSRGIGRAVSGLGLLVLSASVHSSFAVASGTLPPSHLRCESLQEPLGIDVTRPRLSWQLQDTRRGVRQTAYEILVASGPALLEAGKADVWDSGRIESAESVSVSYGGPALESSHRYYLARSRLGRGRKALCLQRRQLVGDRDCVLPERLACPMDRE